MDERSEGALSATYPLAFGPWQVAHSFVYRPAPLSTTAFCCAARDRLHAPPTSVATASANTAVNGTARMLVRCFWRLTFDNVSPVPESDAGTYRGTGRGGQSIPAAGPKAPGNRFGDLTGRVASRA